MRFSIPRSAVNSRCITLFQEHEQQQQWHIAPLQEEPEPV